MPSRSVNDSTWTMAGSTRWRASTSCSTPARARLERIASEPPRRMTALPALTQRAAASMVTFGRAS